jgi:hypothetical protein
MTNCLPCQTFMDDWLSQPISPKEIILYKNINHRRLNRVIPQISQILKRFICNLSESDIQLILSNIQEKPIELLINMICLPKDEMNIELKKHEWYSTTISCKLINMNEIESIIDILRDHFVCKNQNENELLGYYILNLIFAIKELHICHVTKTLSIEDVLEVVILE